MNEFEKMYETKKMTAEQALSLIKDNDYMFSAQAAGEPAAIMSKLHVFRSSRFAVSAATSDSLFSFSAVFSATTAA